ncbi:MAG: arginine--tRNA ligase [Bacteroidetes bacterium]|nr:MAG: arginine--tRNA ligase [Bacteroidota bacterium]
MDILSVLTEKTQAALASLYEINEAEISFEKTNANFKGDYTFVVFPYLRFSRKKPEDTASDIGEYIQKEVEQVSGYNVVKGFLNLELSNDYWLDVAKNQAANGITIPNIGKDKKVVVEYSSPNTNKPLHLGHIRNNVLGFSYCQILLANGYEVIKNNLINDRGIHICKSMLAWQKWGNAETPESSGVKGDHLVGKYYVEFEKQFQAEFATWIETPEGNTELDKHKEAKVLEESKKKDSDADLSNDGILKSFKSNYKNNYFNNNSGLGSEVKTMLQKWEDGDEEVIALWKKMNGWVYDGFDSTYKRMGVSFDKIYYESDTYLLGKAMVQEGLESGAFFTKDDGSVWIDLTDEGLDEKIVQRADGTSVYITQDIGTADLKYKDFGMDKFIYVVGNEQEYHFKVLQLILKKLNKPYADGLYHLSYGMVDLPEGKMKSREGTVVDADELMEEVVATAQKQTEELGKTDGMSSDELTELYETLGMGALKYYLLKIDAKKRIMYDPKESIDFQGNTAPFIQFSYTRIASMLKAANEKKIDVTFEMPNELAAEEKELIVLLNAYPEAVNAAANHYNPSEIANAVYEIAKAFNKFYHEHIILGAKETNVRNFRLSLSKTCGETIKHGFSLLGIGVPERM